MGMCVKCECVRLCQTVCVCLSVCVWEEVEVSVSMYEITHKQTTCYIASNDCIY